jgi:DNA helicase-2/ATP-dependent DNA helicase PcrA
MLALVQYSYDEVDWGDVRVAFGTYLTACSRGSAPPLARSLARGDSLPGALQQRLDAIQAAVKAASATSLLSVAEVAADAWDSLGIIASVAPWNRAAPSFTALVRRAAEEPRTQTMNLVNAVAQVRLGAMFDSQRRRLPAVQVMNLHQTKGREADAVIILSDDEDYHGREHEPFVEGSRLLYVILTRARREVTLLLGREPHPLFAPLALLA